MLETLGVGVLVLCTLYLETAKMPEAP
jgi:hypothetical protein